MTRKTIPIGAGLLTATMAVLSYSGAAASAERATARQHQLASIKEQIAGTWQLVSIYEENDSGEDIDEFGAFPKGRLMTDRRGNFSLQISPEGRFDSADTQGTVNKTPDGGSLNATTYFGTYLVDDASRKLTLRIEHCLFRNCDQTNRTAELKIRGDTMELMSAIKPSLTGAPYSHTIWKRECCM